MPKPSRRAWSAIDFTAVANRDNEDLRVAGHGFRISPGNRPRESATLSGLSPFLHRPDADWFRVPPSAPESAALRPPIQFLLDRFWQDDSIPHLALPRLAR